MLYEFNFYFYSFIILREHMYEKTKNTFEIIKKKFNLNLLQFKSID